MSSSKNDKFTAIQTQFACAVPVKKIKWQVRSSKNPINRKV